MYETGLQGAFDFILNPGSYVQPDANGKVSLEGVPQEDRDAITVMGMQQQLGLKLTSTKGPIERIVIDHAEKIPTENQRLPGTIFFTARVEQEAQNEAGEVSRKPE